MYDLEEFLKAGSQNAPTIIMLVIALTFLAGKFGLKGKAQLGFALGCGLLLGGGLQIAELGTPPDFGGWYFLAVYALVMAIVPSLLYDQAKDLLAKAVSGVLNR